MCREVLFNKFIHASYRWADKYGSPTKLSDNQEKFVRLISILPDDVINTLNDKFREINDNCKKNARSTVQDFLAVASAWGYMVFDPYLVENGKDSYIVLAYNRILHFHDGNFVICYSIDKGAIYSMSQFVYKDIEPLLTASLDKNSRTSKAIAYISILDVGAGLSKMQKLINNKPELIDRFVELVLGRENIPRDKDITFTEFTDMIYSDDGFKLDFNIEKVYRVSADIGNDRIRAYITRDNSVITESNVNTVPVRVRSSFNKITQADNADYLIHRDIKEGLESLEETRKILHSSQYLGAMMAFMAFIKVGWIINKNGVFTNKDDKYVIRSIGFGKYIEIQNIDTLFTIV